MRYRYYKTVLFCTLMIAGSQTCGYAQSRKPNILFFMIDDLGWTDISSAAPNMGNESTYYETPNVDRLAEKGISFTNAYSCGPNCAPTRAALMSGQYGTRTKMYTVSDPNRSRPDQRKLEAAANKRFLDPEQVTLAEALKASGYATGHFGKWHLGGNLGGGLPDRQGFDINVGGTNYGSSTGGYFANADGAFPPRKNLPQMPGLQANGKSGQWLDDRLTDNALDFMEAHKKCPFFVYMSYFAVHTPITAPDEAIAHFNNKPKTERHHNQTYAAFIKSFDDNIGRLTDYLETTDDPGNPGSPLIANTLVIFYSDNGGVGGYWRSGIRALEITDQFPLREGKGSLKEGGIRVPLIVRWDNRIKPGGINHEPVVTVDFYPTLLDVAGTAAPLNTILDGVSLLPAFSGKKLPERALYWHFPAYLEGNTDGDGRLNFRTTPVSVIRKGKYKLLFYYENRRWELYDLAKDIGENNNLAGSHPAIVRSLGQALITWLEAAEADLPQEKETGEQVPLPELPNN